MIRRLLLIVPLLTVSALARAGLVHQGPRAAKDYVPTPTTGVGSVSTPSASAPGGATINVLGMMETVDGYATATLNGNVWIVNGNGGGIFYFYNNGSDPVNLSGMKLVIQNNGSDSIDLANVLSAQASGQSLTIPSTTIPAGDYVIVTFSDLVVLQNNDYVALALTGSEKLAASALATTGD